MSGGVSLAVWMGGVVREVNLLTQASDLRVRAAGEVEPPASVGPAPGSLAGRVRDLYGQLLDLLDLTASVDVLSGTSAGGINAALLGVANARRLDVGGLRDLWLDTGAFVRLLRDPRVESRPPSLLRGDEQLLTGLRDGLNKITADGKATQPVDRARPTTVLITSTLLNGQNGRFTDDYGNAVVDADHRGLFTFSTDQLVGSDAVDALALAARSSASFPAAFEPSFVPIGSGTDDGRDDRHPDMGDYANIGRSAWTADGGLLANRPIGPLLRSVMARGTDREVRRVLLFVVPSPGSTVPPPRASFSAPYQLGKALRLDLDAVLNQSIATDLDAIRRHNDEVGALANTRALLARLAGPNRLADDRTWADYRSVQTAATAGQVAEEMTARMPDAGGWQRLLAPGGRAGARIRAAVTAVVEERLENLPPIDLSGVVALGVPAYDSARAAVLDLLRAGYRLTRRPADIELITRAHKRLNTFSLNSPELTNVVCRAVEAEVPPEPRAPATEWDSVLKRLARSTLNGLDAGLTATANFVDQPPGMARLTGWAALSQVWNDLLAALVDVAPILEQLAAAEPNHSDASATDSSVTTEADTADAAMPPSAAAATRGTPPKNTAGVRRGFADLIEDYLAFLRLPSHEGLDAAGLVPDVLAERLAGRLAELHAAERATSPVNAGFEQRVELIQASANTRTLLDLRRDTAERKLTGIQLHHFAAFYKGTWRANDWMWGRLDGVGWLTQILLDPRRISAIIATQRELDGTPAEGTAAQWFYRRLADIVGDPDTRAAAAGVTAETIHTELAFLDDTSRPVPASLSTVALWAALPLQRLVVAEELAAVAGQIREPANGSPRGAARRWLAQYETAVTGRPTPAPLDGPPTEGWIDRVAATLPDCPIPEETLAAEVGTPLFTRTATQTLAVATAAGTTTPKPPPATLAPVISTARTVTKTAYLVTRDTGAGGKALIWLGLLALGVGTTALFVNVPIVGTAGLVVLLVGAVLLGVGLWRASLKVAILVVAVAISLIAAAPWLPFLRDHLFSWLDVTALPFMKSHAWVWTALFLLILVPPVWMLYDAVIRLRQKPDPPTTTAGTEPNGSTARAAVAALPTGPD